LLRHQGFAALADLQRRLAEGEDPRSTLVHGVLILIAGVVLLTPGFFTDAFGFILLVPAFRTLLINTLGMRIELEAARRAQGARAGRATIDGEYVDVTAPEPKEQATPGNSAWTNGPPSSNPPR
ncbi:MAG: FxsA family protein, partial [Pseudomonadota bacterium]